MEGGNGINDVSVFEEQGGWPEQVREKHGESSFETTSPKALDTNSALTSLPFGQECIISGLLSVMGLKVLHIDRNAYYGCVTAALLSSICFLVRILAFLESLAPRVCVTQWPFPSFRGRVLHRALTSTSFPPFLPLSQWGMCFSELDKFIRKIPPRRGPRPAHGLG